MGSSIELADRLQLLAGPRYNVGKSYKPEEMAEMSRANEWRGSERGLAKRLVNSAYQRSSSRSSYLREARSIQPLHFESNGDLSQMQFVLDSKVEAVPVLLTSVLQSFV